MNERRWSAGRGDRRQVKRSPNGRWIILVCRRKTNIDAARLQVTNRMFTTVTDQAGKVRRSKVDGLGRLIRVDEASDAANTLGSQDSPTQATSYQYDVLGNLTAVTQGNQTRSFSYSSLARLLSATNPESGVISYEYDANGNLTRKTDPRLVPNTSTQRTITYSYDDLGRVTARTYNDSTPNVSYSYDAATVAFSKGRLTAVSSSVSSYSYGEYDPLGRVRTATQTTDGQAYTTAYSYNRAGAIVSQTYPSGRVVATDYDAAGRIAGVRNNATSSYYAGAASTDATNRLQYSATGAIQAMKLGNGLWEHSNFNSRLQLTQIGLGTSSSDSSVLQLDYNYGTTANNGNLLTQTITMPGLTLTQSYTYDEVNREVSAGSRSHGLHAGFVRDGRFAYWYRSLNWSDEALVRKEPELQHAREWAIETVRSACASLVARFADA